jgi:hypothetical protein
MKKSVKFTHYVDPGHSWVRVPSKMLDKLSIANKISSYSYQRTDYVYLEEDCDFSIFLDAMEARGQKVVLVPKHTNRQSRIRSYLPYISPVSFAHS